MSSLTLSVDLKTFENAFASLRKGFEVQAQAMQSWRTELARAYEDVPKVKSNAERLKESLEKLDKAAGKLTTPFAIVSNSFALFSKGLAFFKSQFFDVAIGFERFDASLQATEGSSEKIRQAKSWIADFATSTPHDLAQVTAAFVDLRRLGFDPMDGLLHSLGDAAAAIGETPQQAVRAFADAVMGENEGLKQFGIRASRIGEQMVYDYTDRTGQAQRRTVPADDRAQVSGTVQSILSDKYAGTMGQQSGQLGSMMQNLSDHWTNFTRMVMDAGVFDFLKETLQGLLDEIQRLSGDGTLQAWAKQIGAALIDVFGVLRVVLPVVWQGFLLFGRALNFVANLVGGWGNLMTGLAIILSGPLLVAIFRVMHSLFGLTNVLGSIAKGPFLSALSAVMRIFSAMGQGLWGFISGPLKAAFVALASKVAGFAATIGLMPFVWFIAAAAAAVIGIAVLLIKNWDTISAKLIEIWDGLKGFFAGMIAGFIEDLAHLADMLPAGWGGGWAEKLRGTAASLRNTEAGASITANLPAAKTGAGDVLAQQSAAAGNGTQRTEVVITAANLPPGMKVDVPRSDADDMNFNLGYAMVMP